MVRLPVYTSRSVLATASGKRDVAVRWMPQSVFGLYVRRFGDVNDLRIIENYDPNPAMLQAFEVRTDFWRPDGDRIEALVEVHEKGKRVVVSDDADSLGYIWMNGIDSADADLRRDLAEIARDHHAVIDRGRISVTVDTDDFRESALVEAIHNVAKASFLVCYLILPYRGRFLNASASVE